MAVSVSTYFYDLPATDMRRNKYIHPAGALRIVNLPELFARIGGLSHGPFIYSGGDRRLGADGASESVSLARVPFTIYIVADLDSETGLALVKEALESIVSVFIFYCKDVAV